MSAARRNVELKATDPDPDRTLALALELGARDEGLLRQRDTYFRVPRGRLKLREEEPGGARLVQYERADADAARESRYRLAPVEDAGTLRAALDASLGTLAVVEKERRLLLWRSVRIHLDRVTDLGNFVELEGVAPPDSELSAEGGASNPDLSAQRDDVARAAEALEIVTARILRTSYADQILGASGLVDAARAAMAHAYAPYSGLRVGAAVRAEDGSIHAGANVENSAYPQGWCAEASAIGALIVAGGTCVTEVAVICEGDMPCVPCGGCRQRLSEFAAPGTEVHLCADGGARETTTLAALLPRAFGPELLPR